MSNLRARDALIRDAAAALGVPLHAPAAGVDPASTPPLPPAAVQAFCAELAALAAGLQQEFEEMRAGSRWELRRGSPFDGRPNAAAAALCLLAAGAPPPWPRPFPRSSPTCAAPPPPAPPGARTRS
jgi:hypothetical protein